MFPGTGITKKMWLQLTMPDGVYKLVKALGLMLLYILRLLIPLAARGEPMVGLLLATGTWFMALRLTCTSAGLDSILLAAALCWMMCYVGLWLRSAYLFYRPAFNIAPKLDRAWRKWLSFTTSETARFVLLMLFATCPALALMHLAR